jgi:hypothetical protein
VGQPLDLAGLRCARANALAAACDNRRVG